jgi:thiosulfate dehydrogenase
VKGEGMPTMPKLVGDSARGVAVYARTCVPCHQPDGQGVAKFIPPVWGPNSYAIGASMAREERAASFIKYFMPKSAPESLTDQEAYDVAAYINSMPRPDSPGKENDWANGGAPKDVPYDTKGHAAYKPPSKLIARTNTAGMTVPNPAPIKKQTQRAKAQGY